MRKQKKSFSSYYFIIAVTAVGFVFSYLFLTAEIKGLSKSIVEKSQVLDQKNNQLDEVMVEYQRYSSEERVVNIAKDSLGLVRSLKPVDVITVSEKQVIQINRLVNKRYD